MTFATGNKYAGEWKNGARHGQGTFTWSNGYKYVGEWKDDKLWKGTEYDKDGSVTATFSEVFKTLAN